jgi:hypothetical protein
MQCAQRASGDLLGTQDHLDKMFAMIVDERDFLIISFFAVDRDGHRHVRALLANTLS